MNCGYCGHTMLRHCSKGCTVNDCECTVRYPDPLAPTNYVDRQQQLQKKAHNQGLEFSDLQGQYSSFGFQILKWLVYVLLLTVYLMVVGRLV